MTAVIFGIVLICTSAHAFARGGAPERVVAVALLIAAVLSAITTTRTGAIYAAPEFGLVMIDLPLFVVLITVALRSTRFWPMLLASAQGVALLGHLAKLLAPDIVPVAYFVLVADWSFPMQLMLSVATFRHQHRCRRLGWDPDWTGDLPDDYHLGRRTADQLARTERLE